MANLCIALVNDEAGFIVSAELVLVATIAVLSMVVGLSQVSNSINNELNDVANAFGSLNQGFSVQGAQGCKGQTTGSFWNDCPDTCDQSSIVCTNAPQAEGSY